MSVTAEIVACCRWLKNVPRQCYDCGKGFWRSAHTTRTVSVWHREKSPAPAVRSVPTEKRNRRMASTLLAVNTKSVWTTEEQKAAGDTQYREMALLGSIYSGTEGGIFSRQHK